MLRQGMKPKGGDDRTQAATYIDGVYKAWKLV